MESAATPYFFYAMGILFREGLEALVVIAALLAAVRRSGQSASARDIYIGAGAALVASVVLAVALNRILSDEMGDTLEGVFQLIGAATLFYVSSWMTAKAQADSWRDFVKSQIDRAVHSSMPSRTLGLTAFVAVLREGAETIVFFQALMGGATERVEKHAVALGIAAASAALLLAFVMLEKAMARMPLGAFFRWTSVLLYAMAVIFVGQGIASWQESGLLAATFIDGVPTVKVVGLYPTVQTLVPQLVLIGVALLAPLYRRIRGARKQAPAHSHSRRIAA
jgi:high-affinity iron transporter